MGLAAVRSITKTQKYRRAKLGYVPAEAPGGHHVAAPLPRGIMPTRHQAASLAASSRPRLSQTYLSPRSLPLPVASQPQPGDDDALRHQPARSAPKDSPARASLTFKALGPEAKRDTESLWSISRLVVRLSQKGKKPCNFKDLRGEPRHQTPDATVKPRNFAPSNPPRLLVIPEKTETPCNTSQRMSVLLV